MQCIHLPPVLFHMVVSANRFASQRKASTCVPWAVGWVGGEREKGEEQDLDVGEIGDNFHISS